MTGIAESTIRKAFDPDKHIQIQVADKIATALGKDINALFDVRDAEKGLSNRTIHHYHAFIRAVLGQALADGVILVNVADQAHKAFPKRMKLKKKGVDPDRYLQQDEAQRLADAVRALPEEYYKWQVAIILLLTLGLRRGELLGLEWSKINFDRNTMQISPLSSTGYIKNLVTAEIPIDIEAKGKQSEQALLYTKLLCIGNGSPKTLYDKSKGFSRRLIILTTLPPPENRVNDPHIADKFTAEKEKIFFWMYDGLLRLIGNNYHFTISEKAELNVKETVQDSCNIPEFLADTSRVTFGDKLCVTSSALYSSYVGWCEDNALTAFKREMFISWLKQNENQLHLHYSTNIKYNGKYVRGFKGIALIRNPY